MPPPASASSPSQGIKGCVKDRILHDMVDATPGKFKILIADTTCTAILNACMKMDDLMAHDVTLIENITNKRQPISTSPAIYFVCPTADNVTRIVQDWATRDMYSEAHIFFVSVSSNDVLRDLRGSRLAREKKVKTLKDLLISFQAPERLVFTLAEKTDLPYFFGAMAPSATARDQRLKMANQLSAALYTLSSEMVVVRHQNTPTSSDFAGMLQESYDLLKSEAAKLGEVFRKNERNPAPTTVLIVDRSVDACAPLVHDLHYQAMLDDFMPLLHVTITNPPAQEHSPRCGSKIRNSGGVSSQVGGNDLTSILTGGPSILVRLPFIDSRTKTLGCPTTTISRC
jgi:syntaxin-binding protein 1